VADAVKLPRLGQGMEAGTVVRWLKAEGDTVAKGEPLYELDTDKVTQEVEAESAGVLLRIVVSEGEAPVGATLAFIGDAGETVDIEVPEPPTADGKARPEEAVPPRELPPVAAVAAPPPREPGQRVKASPLARRLARERGIDLARLTGTGPEGRIVAEDVERAAAGKEAPAPPTTPPVAPPAIGPTPIEAERIPLTSVRRTIAQRLTDAWQIPVFQLVSTAEMTAVDSLLSRRRELEPEVRFTVTDVLVTICAAALMRHREVNAEFTDDALVLHRSASIGIAAATVRGLVVPVLHDAERLSLHEVSAARADLVARARAGTLRYDDLEGGTFTISNLGMFGLDQFTAVLNPPQAAILAVGSTQERPVVRDGDVVARPTMTMTLTCDHRAVDGAPAAAFLDTVKALLEEPGLAL
jgi:pyruvate dehydrogenase E2 component (dihydrolipoamide acetyltransferase)